jgi:hypothetical protein
MRMSPSQQSTPSQEREYDEDITSLHLEGSTSMQGPMTRARARRLGQKVNSFLRHINYLITEPMILPNDFCLLITCNGVSEEDAMGDNGMLEVNELS